MNKRYKFILNGIKKEIYARNLLKALVCISKEYPEVRKQDYRTLNIVEL